MSCLGYRKKEKKASGDNAYSCKTLSRNSKCHFRIIVYTLKKSDFGAAEKCN